MAIQTERVPSRAHQALGVLPQRLREELDQRPSVLVDPVGIPRKERRP